MSLEGQVPGIPVVNDGGLGWLVQPVWEKDLFGDIAGAKQMTPEVVRAVETVLAATKEKAPATAPLPTHCDVLEKCGTFVGGTGDCNSLKECSTFTNKFV